MEVRWVLDKWRILLQNFQESTRARFRLEHKWLTLAPFLRADSDSMGAGEENPGRGAPRQL